MWTSDFTWFLTNSTKPCLSTSPTYHAHRWQSARLRWSATWWTAFLWQVPQCLLSDVCSVCSNPPNHPSAAWPGTVTDKSYTGKPGFGDHARDSCLRSLNKKVFAYKWFLWQKIWGLKLRKYWDQSPIRSRTYRVVIYRVFIVSLQISQFPKQQQLNNAVILFPKGFKQFSTSKRKY